MTRKSLLMFHYFKFNVTAVSMFVALLLICLPTTTYSNIVLESREHSYYSQTEQYSTLNRAFMKIDKPTEFDLINISELSTKRNQVLISKSLTASQIHSETLTTTAPIAPIEISNNPSSATHRDIENFQSIAQLTNPLPQPSATSGTPTVAIFSNDTSIVEGTRG